MLNRLLLTLCVLLVPVTGYAFPDTPVLSDLTGVDNTTPPVAGMTNSIIFGVSSANMRIRSNGMTTVTSGTEADVTWDTAFNADQEVYATINDVSGATDFHTVCGRLVQIGSSTTDGYCVYADDAGDTVNLILVTNGAQVGGTLGTWAQNPAAGDKLGLKMVGSSICAWYKTAAGAWTEKGCVTDTTHAAGGKVGWAVQAANSVAAMDDPGGGNVVATRRAIAPLIFSWLVDPLQTLWNALTEPTHAFAY
jgi:hypothetical protein